MAKAKSTKKPKKKVTRKVAISKLRKRCLKLWSVAVRARAGNVCEAPGCGSVEYLNAHHIESYRVHPGLRYSLPNGICLCAGHHKYSSASAHQSFLFMLDLLRRMPGRFEALLRQGTETAGLTLSYEELLETEKVLGSAVGVYEAVNAKVNTTEAKPNRAEESE